MSVLTKNDVHYFEVTFTIRHSKDSNKIKGNFERELLELMQEGGVDVLIDASYGKGFETIHFNLEFSEASDFKLVEEALEDWAIENGAIEF